MGHCGPLARHPLQPPHSLLRPPPPPGPENNLHRRRLRPQGGRPAQRPAAPLRGVGGLCLDRLGRPACLQGPGFPAGQYGFPQHPLGPVSPAAAGRGRGAVPVPPPGDRPGAVYPERISAPRPRRTGVRGLHRLPPARVPRGPFDGGKKNQARFFVQKRGDHRLVLWAVIGYNGIKTIRI